MNKSSRFRSLSGFRFQPSAFSSAFTLLELLIVIAIIGILVAMILGAVAAAKKYTLRTAAATEVKSIENAWIQYYSEYQRWPAFISNDDTVVVITGRVARLLQGLDTNDNFKNMAFMQFSRFDPASNPVSTLSQGGLASSNYYFYCRFDMDFNHVIRGGSGPASDVTRPVVVWTINPDVTNNDGRIIGSWMR